MNWWHDEAKIRGEKQSIFIMSIFDVNKILSYWSHKAIPYTLFNLNTF